MHFFRRFGTVDTFRDAPAGAPPPAEKRGDPIHPKNYLGRRAGQPLRRLRKAHFPERLRFREG